MCTKVDGNIYGEKYTIIIPKLMGESYLGDFLDLDMGNI